MKSLRVLELEQELIKQKELTNKLIKRLEFHEQRWIRDVEYYELKISNLEGILKEFY
jgi:hypothetical protein